MASESLGLVHVTSTVDIKMGYRRDTGLPENPSEVQYFYQSQSTGYTLWLEEKLLLAIKELKDDKRR